MKLTKTILLRALARMARNSGVIWSQLSLQAVAVKVLVRAGMDACYWCHTKFQDGDTIALALANKGNQALCQNCAKLLLASDPNFIEADPEYTRASGDQTCPTCHKKYYDHPKDPHHPYLTQLCNGTKVKL